MGWGGLVFFFGQTGHQQASARGRSSRAPPLPLLSPSRSRCACARGACWIHHHAAHPHLARAKQRVKQLPEGQAHGWSSMPSKKKRTVRFVSSATPPSRRVSTVCDRGDEGAGRAGGAWGGEGDQPPARPAPGRKKKRSDEWATKKKKHVFFLAGAGPPRVCAAALCWGAPLPALPPRVPWGGSHLPLSPPRAPNGARRRRARRVCGRRPGCRAQPAARRRAVAGELSFVFGRVGGATAAA